MLSRPESYSSKADKNPSTGKPLDIGITGLENPGNAKESEGFFAKGVLKAMESANVANNAHEVKVIGNGHCHGVTFFCLLLTPVIFFIFAVTENCRRVHGVWLCFGGGG